jgi:hypothetical protein
MIKNRDHCLSPFRLNHHQNRAILLKRRIFKYKTVFWGKELSAAIFIALYDRYKSKKI